MTTKYRTIVADPPWPMGNAGAYSWREGRESGHARPLPYAEMTLAEITALPIADLAEPDAHLFVWTVNRHLEATFGIVRAWGFSPTTPLVWCKAPHGFNPGGTFGSTAEFVIFARRGSLPATQRVQTQWWQWPRGEHSAKPEAFLDVVETVSPGPYLELFARRNRLGWDTWGNECLDHVDLRTGVGS